MSEMDRHVDEKYNLQFEQWEHLSITHRPTKKAYLILHVSQNLGKWTYLESQFSKLVVFITLIEFVRYAVIEGRESTIQIRRLG
jgi:hypothetical protein